MPIKTNQIKFRMDDKMKRRVEWAIYCGSAGSQQEAIEIALERWLIENESRFGPPVEPKSREQPSVDGRHAVGS